MKLQILDDLHIDYPGSRGIPALAHGVDVVIVAGDTCHGLTQAIGSLRSAYPSPTEIVMVAGNHELWSADWPSRSTSRKAMPPPNWPTSTFLENQVVTIDGVRIVGATLWTDYELFGPDLREAAMRAAADHMLDHKRIKWRSDPWARSNPTGYSDENRHFDASFVVELPN